MLTEEEKKAINQLKYDTNFYDYELKNGNYIYELFKIEVYKKDVDVTLNLIEKLQKEIEDSIPKDKIREKIKELDNWDSEYYKRVTNHIEYTLTELVKNILSELLEEEQ